jgi:hypothetical protein
MSVTSDDDAVGAVIDLLQNAASADWTPTTPEIKQWWDDAQNERGPGADMAPILYVWSPTGSSLERFSMDGTRFDRSDTIEVQCWSLDATEAEQLRRDVVDIISEYLDDNETDTPYTDIQPTTSSDFREQKQARRTDHYITSVEIETRDLDPTDK